ncbi:F-actin-uncapping protein LRRC16A-like isoform X2 [Clytia hemisphaerica]|uniref:CARMIL pleckstrin homology domain-containing protein n=1 Tax=Clytia hemisphaerica TaxID=252671 RepID=A0A7M5V607_9CNID|eukprot:TCONS_00050300-protein
MAVSMEEAKADYLAAKQAIGNKETKIIFVRKCKFEGKHDKPDNKILAITSYRVYVISKKSSQAKVDFSFHLLDLITLDGSKPLTLSAQVNAGDKQFQYTFSFVSQDDVDRCISYVKALLKKNLLDANVDKQLSIKVESEEKQQLIRNQTNVIVQSFASSEEQCGGLAQAYLFLADYYNQLPIAEIVWDINKIYGSHSSKDFKLEDFDHLEQRELVPLVAALGYNAWFEKLIVKNTKLTNELADTIIKVVKRTSSIEEVIIVNCHLNKEHAHRLSQAITTNPNKVLKRIDLSRNNIEEKGVSGFAGAFSLLSYGFEEINFSHSGITPKGASLLINSLKNNKNMSSTLTKLSLSGNQLKADAAQPLCDFLAQPNALETLELSNSECALELMFGALMRGCQQNLKVLDLSGNPFSYKKSKETQSLPTVQQFFSSCASLNTLSLSNTKLPSESVKAMMVGLMSNPLLTDFELDLSHNELKSVTAQEVASVIGQIRCLRKLNLSNNALDNDLVTICEAVEKSTSIKELDFSSTITKSKHINAISESLADMAMTDTLPLEKLFIADNKLKLGASALFDCLGTNESIRTIDISGNGIGDIGARLLAKALQINTNLREVLLDRNNISYKGLQDISYAMHRNFTLQSLPLPINDFSQALKHNADLYMKYYKKIEEKLIKNQSSTDSSQEQAYKIHQGFLLSTSDSYTQSTDALVVELQDLVSKNKTNATERVQSQIKRAKSLISETDTFRLVLAELFSDPAAATLSLNDKISNVADDVATSVEDVIKESVDSMLSSAKKICPTVFTNEEQLISVKGELSKDGLVDRSSISNIIVRLGKGDIVSKLCKSNLTTAVEVAEHLKKILVEALQNAISSLKVALETPVTPVTTETPAPKSEETNEEETPQKEEEEEKKESEKAAETTGEKEPEKPADLEKQTDSLEVTITSSEAELPPTSPLASPAVHVEKTTDLLGEIMGNKESFDMPWDVAAGNRLSMQISVSSDKTDDDEDFSLAVLKARDRLSTLQAKDFDRKKKKKSSLKRRPTFYRQEDKTPTATDEIEVDIGIGGVDSGRSSSMSSTQTPSTPKSPPPPSVEDDDEEPVVIELDEIDSKAEPSVATTPAQSSVAVEDFDALSTNAAPLQVNKGRAKPMAGRRAPSRVSKLAHMNVENTEKFIEEQSKAAPPPASTKPSPKQRPVSEMPTVALSPPETDKPPRRSTSEKIKNALKPDPKPPKPAPSGSTPTSGDSKKEKKGKSPIGGIKLPSLSLSSLKRNRASSKGTDIKKETDVKKEMEEQPSKAEEKVNSKPSSAPEVAAPVEELKAPEPAQKPPSPAPKPSEETPSDAPLSPPAKEEEPEAKPTPAPSPKPEATKRPMVPKAGLPMMGGAALMAEMKKRQNKDKPEQPAPPPAAKPKPPPAAQKPGIGSRAGSVSGPKPSPPKRPVSLKPTEGKSDVPDEKPKPAIRPRLNTTPKPSTPKPSAEPTEEKKTEESTTEAKDEDSEVKE